MKVISPLTIALLGLYSPRSSLFPPTACVCTTTHAGSCHDDRWYLWRSLAHSYVDQQKFSVIAAWIIPESREGKQLPEWIKKTLPWVCRGLGTHRWLQAWGCVSLSTSSSLTKKKQKSHNSIFKHIEEIKHLLKYPSQADLSTTPSSFFCLFLVVVEVNDRASRASQAYWMKSSVKLVCFSCWVCGNC